MKTYDFELEGGQGPVVVSIHIDDLDAPGELVGFDMRDFDPEYQQMLAAMSGQDSDALLCWGLLNDDNGAEAYEKRWNIATGTYGSDISDALRAALMLTLGARNRATAIGITCTQQYRTVRRFPGELLTILIDSLVTQDAIASMLRARDYSLPFETFLDSFVKLQPHLQTSIIDSVSMGRFDITSWKTLAEASGDRVKFMLVAKMARSPNSFNYALVARPVGGVLSTALDITEMIESENDRADALVSILMQTGGQLKPRIAERIGNMLLKIDERILCGRRGGILYHSNVFPERLVGKLMVLLNRPGC